MANAFPAHISAIDVDLAGVSLATPRPPSPTHIAASQRRDQDDGPFNFDNPQAAIARLRRERAVLRRALRLANETSTRTKTITTTTTEVITTKKNWNEDSELEETNDSGENLEEEEEEEVDGGLNVLIDDDLRVDSLPYYSEHDEEVMSRLRLLTL